MIGVSINGVDTDGVVYDSQARPFNRGIHYPSGMSWSLLVSSQGQCNVPIIVPPNDTFNPAIDETIEIFETLNGVSQRVWYGTVTSLAWKYLGDDGWAVVTITGATPERQLQDTLLDTTYTSQNGGAIAADLLGKVGSPDITSGVIATGATIDNLPVKRVSDALDITALISGMPWYINPRDATLNQHAPNANPLPDDFVSSDTQHDIRWETVAWNQNSNSQRNQQSASDGSTTATAGSGAPMQAYTLGGSASAAGLQQLATGILDTYQPTPPTLVFKTDRADVNIGHSITLVVTRPVGAGPARLNGGWYVMEIEAELEAGLDLAPEPYGHFTRTLHLSNNATMPPQNHIQAAEQLTNVGPEPPASPGTGQIFSRTLLIKNTTVGSRIADVIPVYHDGTGMRVVAMLHDTITADLQVQILKAGLELIEVTVPSATAVDTAVVFALVSGSPAVAPTFHDLEPLVANVLASDGSSDEKGICSLTIEWVGGAV